MAHKGKPEKDTPVKGLDEGTKITKAKPARPEVTGVRYVGNGNYISGIPQRDLPKEEWEKLPENLRKAAIELVLYEFVN